MNLSGHRESSAVTWLAIFLLVVLVFAKGFFSFFVVGDLGQPDWDYGTVRDVPAESPYAIYHLLPHPQHVRGAKGE
jgi:hypothetical protein